MSTFVSDDRVPSSVLADKLGVMRNLRADWTRFQTEGVVGSPIRSVIARSWHRSRQLDVSPDRRAADVERGALRGFDSRDQVRRLLLDAAAPIRRLLSDELDGSNSAVVLCDEAGRIIARDGDASILRRTEAQNFVPGADWSEECAGTNGIGLALALGRPAQVFSAEHFCVGFQDYACTAAPLRHPVTRATIGVLDVTTRASEITHHTFAMVVHAAREIEREMEEHVFGRERELLERYLRGRVGQEVPFFTVDRSGRTIIQNAVAAETLPSEDLPAVMHVVRRSLRSGADAESELDLSTGRGVVECHLVRSDGDPIGALVSVRPLRSTRAARPSADWQPLVGRSPGMRDVLARAQRLAELCVPAVVVGEAGTGKLALALAMHERSVRGERPAVVVNCAKRGWRDVLQSGDTPDATVILRRLAALDDPQQLELAALVEELQERGAWTISILTSGDRPLRLELLHRLGASQLAVPPLRERGGDLELLVAHWRRSETLAGRTAPTFSSGALDALRLHDWPGNVRELLNTLTTTSLGRPGALVRQQDIVLSTSERTHRRSELREVEREAITRALADTGGNVSQAADLLGISRSTLHRRLSAYRLIGR